MVDFARMAWGQKAHSSYKKESKDIVNLGDKY